VALARGDSHSVALLGALLDIDGELVLYHPSHDHYAVVLGDLDSASNIAVLVPGVGDDIDLVMDWLPWASNLFEVTHATAVVLWRGYDDPRSIAVAAVDIALEDRRSEEGAARLSAFVSQIKVRAEQRVTVVAHSFGSLVAGESLAYHGLVVDDLVVLGSPGVGVESLNELHLHAGHLFAEKAPGDVVAGLGVAGTDPATRTFGATRMATNAAGRPAVTEHANYFTRGSQALENVGDVVMGRYDRIVVQRATAASAVGAAVTVVLKTPAWPVILLATRYRGPGHRIVRMVDRAVHVVATESGAVVRDAVERFLALGDRTNR
jgi:pimeloyl-ACP methyl ester carboxylesterase